MVYGLDVYWNLVFLVLYAGLGASLFIIAREICRAIKDDKRLALLFLVVPLLMLLPVEPKGLDNAFMHKGLARALSRDPLQRNYCIKYEQGSCTMDSYPPWTYAYHIFLRFFVDGGDLAIKLMNSFLVAVFAFFTHLMLREKTQWGALITLIPPFFVFISEPVLNLFSLCFGSVVMYLFLRFLEGGTHLTEFVVTASFFVHIRPENFIYLFFLLPYVLGALVEEKGALAWGLLNSVVKAFEYSRGRSFTYEWGLHLAERVVIFTGNALGSTAYLLNPVRFNVLLSVAVLAGAWFLARKGKLLLAALPFVGFFIYNSRYDWFSFTGTLFTSRYLFDMLFVSLPCINEFFREVDIPKVFLVLVLLPLLTADYGAGSLYGPLQSSLEHKEEICNISRQKGLQIISPFFYELRECGNTSQTGDTLWQGPGEYLFVSRDFYYGHLCEGSLVERMGEVGVYEMTCGG